MTDQAEAESRPDLPELAPPVLPDLGAQKDGAGEDAAPCDSLKAVYDVPIRVQAVLGRARMEIASLMQLKSGDVVELDRRVGEPVDILVNNRPMARGEGVLIDGRLGVTLTEIVKQDR